MKITRIALLLFITLFVGIGLSACGLSPAEVEQVVNTVESLPPSELAGLAATVEALPPEQIASADRSPPVPRPPKS